MERRPSGNWREGSSIKMHLDLDKGVMQFFFNDSPIGAAEIDPPKEGKEPDVWHPVLQCCGCTRRSTHEGDARVGNEFEVLQFY